MGPHNRDRSSSGASGFLAPPFMSGGNKRYSGSSPSPASSLNSTPFSSPVPVDLKQFSSSPGVPVHNDDHSATDSKRNSLNMGKSPPSFNVDLPKDTSPEMVPVLTLLMSQQSREYLEGYFMILSDLNTVNDRRWVEVFGKLTGNVLSIWDADTLSNATGDREPTPTYINVTDSSFKSIVSLPSPNGDLENIIVLSTTMKNRYLLQFSSSKLLQEWTAALRLSIFEYMSLQESYTGALLSSKGSKLNGIRTLLAETKFRHEEYCRVRFGSGMPWRQCWTVITPPDLKAKKKEAPAGTIAFYEDKKKTKKTPLAIVTHAYAAFAVFPEKSVLVNSSTLIKIDGRVSFSEVDGERDTPIFIMPDAHPGVQGFETLIRFLIPVLDVFKLYGRPKRLNADKSDMRSLLFGMPSLPRNQYLDVTDLMMLVGLSGSERWTGNDWTKNIKELLARKIATGYKGTGNLRSSSPSSRSSSVRTRDRSVSQPSNPESRMISKGSNSPNSPYLSDGRSDGKNSSSSISSEGMPRPPPHLLPADFGIPVDDDGNKMVESSQGYIGGFAPEGQLKQNGMGPPEPPNIQARSGFAPGLNNNRVPQPPIHQAYPSNNGSVVSSPNYGPGPGPGPDGRPRYVQKAPPPISVNGNSSRPYQGNFPGSPQYGPQGAIPSRGPYPMSATSESALRKTTSHERSASEGADPNNLMSGVHAATQPLSPVFDMKDNDAASNRSGMRKNIFGNEETHDGIDSSSRYGNSPRSNSSKPVSSPEKHQVRRRPVSGDVPPPIAPQASRTPPPSNMFDPTATFGSPHGAFHQSHEALNSGSAEDLHAPRRANYEYGVTHPLSPNPKRNAPLAPPHNGGYRQPRPQSPHGVPNSNQGSRQRIPPAHGPQRIPQQELYQRPIQRGGDQRSMRGPPPHGYPDGHPLPSPTSMPGKYPQGGSRPPAPSSQQVNGNGPYQSMVI